MSRSPAAEATRGSRCSRGDPMGKVRTDHAGEETERSGGIPAQAEFPADAGAVVAGGPAAAAPAAPVRDPEARRHVAALRRAAGSWRRAEVVGGAEGAVDGPAT